MASSNDSAYRVRTAWKGSTWIAWAERAEDGSRFGIECEAPTAAEACARLTQWLEWQREHATALTALQQAERDYHRTIAGSAFASEAEGPSPVEMQSESLKAVEAARLRLDEIRARKPE
jgi:hypothetical protein